LRPRQDDLRRPAADTVDSHFRGNPRSAESESARHGSRPRHAHRLHLGLYQPFRAEGAHAHEAECHQALWRDTLVDAAIFREWIVNVGQRAGINRLAHIIMELRERLRVIGRTSGAEFDLPLTHEQFGEAMGITSIHVNRILKQLQNAGVMKVRRRRVTILDEAKFGALRISIRCTCTSIRNRECKA